MRIAIPCECKDEEHSVDVEAESAGYGIHAAIGLHSPTIGDPLPCGRSIDVKDIVGIICRLEEWGREDP